MDKLTKEIKSEIRKYINYAKKMQECRENIEAYFLSIGIDLTVCHNSDDEDSKGAMITDCLVDAGSDYDFKNTVKEIEKIINEKYLKKKELK